MAGWDLDFSVDERDEHLARGCFRILRRTCARYYVEFSYYLEAKQRGRLSFVLVFDGRPFNVGLAAGEFAYEMRAVSTFLRGRRQQRMPLRLLRDVAWTGSDLAIEEQIDGGKVPTDKRNQVVRLLQDYETSLASFSRGELGAADFVEAQHSLFVNLVLGLEESAKVSDSAITLCDKLNVTPGVKGELELLRRSRNAIKHRGRRELADSYAWDGHGTIHRMVRERTGVFLNPVPQIVRGLVADQATVFRLPPMFGRFGEPRRPRR
jgi:hypothetical protein